MLFRHNNYDNLLKIMLVPLLHPNTHQTTMHCVFLTPFYPKQHEKEEKKKQSLHIARALGCANYNPNICLMQIDRDFSLRQTSDLSYLFEWLKRLESNHEVTV